MRRLTPLLLFLAACSNEPERWQCWIYPEGLGTPASDWIVGGPFTSLEGGRDWVDATARERFPDGRPSRFDYECGSGCRLQGGINVCEKNSR